MPSSDLGSVLGAPELTPPAPQPAPQAAAPAAPAGLPSLGTGPGYVTQDAITSAAQTAGIDPDLYTRVIRQESGGRIAASSQKGALGPAQLMPDTATTLGVNPNDPVQNLQGGAKYLRSLLDRYGGDEGRALAAYNAGPDAVDKAGDIPKIPETQAYVAAIQGAGPPQLANAMGLTAEERQGLAPYTAAAPTTAAGQQPGTGQLFNFGPNFQHMPLAAEQTFQRIATDPTRGATKDNPMGGIDATAALGSPRLPYYAAPGTVVPVTPGVHWVDADGNEHVNPGGALERAEGALAGFGQGSGADLAASIGRLSGGRLPDEGQYGPRGMFMPPPDQDVQQALNQQQHDYAIRHLGDPYAQTGRFLGQGTDAALAGLTVPEIDVPGAALTGAGRLATIAGRASTNALRGVASVAPSVGANPNTPVATQLGLGALGGTVLPEALEIGNKAGMTVAGAGGWGRTVSPEVADLANLAQTKFKMPLRSGQVMGAAGDEGAQAADSNMLGSSASARANAGVQRKGWMSGVTNSYGDTSGDVSPEALTANQDRIGGRMNDFANKVGQFDASGVPAKLDATLAEARQVVGANDVAPLENLIANIKSVINPDGTMSAKAYQGLTRVKGPLMRAVQNADTPYAGDVKDILDDALGAASNPADLADFQNARWQYKNLMTVAKAAVKGDPIDGSFTPAALDTAVNSNFKNRAFQGAGDLGDAVRVGKAFLKQPPNSFTPARLIDFSEGLRNAGTAAGLTELGMMVAHQPENVLPSALAGLAGGTARIAGGALKNSRIAGPATGIIQRSLPNSPGTVSALSGLGSVRKSLEVPLSALAGVRGFGALNPAPVGANAQ